MKVHYAKHGPWYWCERKKVDGDFSIRSIHLFSITHVVCKYGDFWCITIGRLRISTKGRWMKRRK